MKKQPNHIECLSCDYAGPGFKMTTKQGTETYCNYCVRRQIARRFKDKDAAKRMIEAIRDYD